MTHHEEGDVVAGEARKIGKDSMELRRLGEAHADLLLELSGKRRLDRLVPFDAAAGEEPARPIAVAHEKHAVVPSMTTPCAPSVSPLRIRQNGRSTLSGPSSEAARAVDFGYGVASSI